MHIDWLTVSAQIVNFLILVWLLKRFLYRPVVQAMERREQRIRERLREGERKQEEAEDEARSYREKQRELAQRREQMLAEAREQAAGERDLLERQAREEIEARKRDWLKQLEQQRETFLRELRRRTTQQFYRLARRALRDLADADLQDQVARAFITQVEMLDAGTRETIEQACRQSDNTVRVRSLFELSADSRHRITRALRAWLGEGLEIEYATADDAPFGIELKAGSQTVSWGFGSYLDEYEKAVAEQLAGVPAAAEVGAGK